MTCKPVAQLLARFGIVFAVIAASAGPASGALPATRPSATLADLWDQRATWVHDAAGVGGAFNFHYLSVVAAGTARGELVAFYIRHATAPDGKFKLGVGRARSTDGVTWTDDGGVLAVGGDKQWDDRIASFPGAWKDGETWYLVYEGAAEDIAFSPGDIGLATSTDGGKTFTKHPTPILRHETGGWERTNIGTPSLYRANGVWYLFYHGYDGNVCQVGVASGTSLTALTKSPANPILPVDTDPAAWDCGTTGKRSAIVKDGAYYYMAFEGSTPQPYERARWSSGLARTRDLTAKWTKFPGNPMIPQTPGGMGYDGPELLRLGGAWHLYVRSPDSSGLRRFRLEGK